jgi:hypothetical protein
MITEIVSGMTPEEFVIAINNNFKDVVLQTPVLLNDTMSSTDWINAVNNNAGTNLYVGQKNLIDEINSKFGSFDVSISAPSALTVIWSEDYATVSFTDNSGGIAQHQIYEELQGVYSLVTTLNAGVTTYKYFTWQNASLNFKVRAIGSALSPVVNIATPLVFKTNQTSLSQVLLRDLSVIPGKAVSLTWGDGSAPLAITSRIYDTTHNYVTPASSYFITLSGDTDWMDYFEIFTQTNLFGDISKWIMPSHNLWWHTYGCVFTGYLNKLKPVSGQIIYHVGWQPGITGEFTNLVFPSSIADFHIEGCKISGDVTNWVFTNPWPTTASTGHIIMDGNLLTGNATNWILRQGMTNLRFGGGNQIVANMSGWVIPTSLSQFCPSLWDQYHPDWQDTNILSGNISAWVLPVTANANGFTWMIANQPNVTGDLSTWLMPDTKGASSYNKFDLRGCGFTKMPRGSFKYVSIFNFSGNKCYWGEVDSFLVYLDNYFTGGVVPWTGCLYSLDGVEMGAPSAVGLAAKASIESKYATPVAITALVIGQSYTILSVGDSNWVAVGGPVNSNVGTVFTATGTGTGTGTANHSCTITVNTAVTKFLNTFAIRIGGGDLVAGDEAVLSKYDSVVLNRFHYNDIGETFKTLRALNPNIKILLYQSGTSTSNAQDSSQLIRLNSIARWLDARGHSMGNLSVDNPTLFLLDSNGDHILYSAGSNFHEMDFGNADYVDYWIEATTNDIINQIWKADGIFLDGLLACRDGINFYSANSVDYPNDAAWVPAMNGFVNSTAGRLRALSQLSGGTRSYSRYVNGKAAWLALDALSTPPDFALEEGAIAIGWGSNDVQFFTVAEWLRQIDTLKGIVNYKPLFLSHTDLSPDGQGYDNYSQHITFWEILWFALTSFCIGKKDNSYFSFMKADNFNVVPPYFDEYDINLGSPVGDYSSEIISGITIYKREFVLGYVYVNPNISEASGITLPGLCKQLTHENLPVASGASISSFNLPAHRGSIFIKIP